MKINITINRNDCTGTGLSLPKKNKPLLIEQWVKSEKILNNKTIEAAKIHEEKSYCIFKETLLKEQPGLVFLKP